MVVPPYVGMSRKQNGSYNASDVLFPETSKSEIQINFYRYYYFY